MRDQEECEVDCKGGDRLHNVVTRAGGKTLQWRSLRLVQDGCKDELEPPDDNPSNQQTDVDMSRAEPRHPSQLYQDPDVPQGHVALSMRHTDKPAISS